MKFYCFKAIWDNVCLFIVRSFVCLFVFIGYAYEELSEVSPDHKFLAYTMYDKDNDSFRLSVRNLNSGALCSKPQADRVSNLAWAKDGQALLYVVTDQHKRPCRLVLHGLYNILVWFISSICAFFLPCWIQQHEVEFLFFCHQNIL